MRKNRSGQRYLCPGLRGSEGVGGASPSVLSPLGIYIVMNKFSQFPNFRSINNNLYEIFLSFWKGIGGIGEGLLVQMKASRSKPKGGVAMKVIQVVWFYEGRMKLQGELHPATWHPRSEIVEVVGDEEVPEWVVQEAEEYGWRYNPHTKTFYKPSTG
jgi:hypothetical protein